MYCKRDNSTESKKMRQGVPGFRIIFKFCPNRSLQFCNKRFYFQYVLGKSVQWSPDKSPGESLDESKSKFWAARLSFINSLLKLAPNDIFCIKDEKTKNELSGGKARNQKNANISRWNSRNRTIATDSNHKFRSTSITILS